MRVLQVSEGAQILGRARSYCPLKPTLSPRAEITSPRMGRGRRAAGEEVWALRMERHCGGAPGEPPHPLVAESSREIPPFCTHTGGYCAAFWPVVNMLPSIPPT